MERVTIDLDALTDTDREALYNQSAYEGRALEDVVLDLIHAGLHSTVRNVNTGHVSGHSVQTARIDGDIHF
ncbi:hypothetical protein [Saccharopolyspora sp. 6V]|uniref:hypothetical protein n=1 Tax=Saccharopolyspora sp. 6V TaxID=2877239 RepID=UPI001CD69404|nr:hypothetical protein [Saccharopolyspora sp. 6V]MCA1195331.1 hypothetical protein [Saccharopolyspora sp. 6V]